MMLDQEGFIAGLSVDGTALTLLRTSAEFQGMIEPIAPLDPTNLLFGSDPREDAILHVLRRDCPALVQGDRISDAESFVQNDVIPRNPGQPADPSNPAALVPIIYKVQKRVSDPSDPVVKFTLIKVTEQDSG